MRIALVTDGIWPYVLGGMQKHSYYVCKYLAAAKVQVDLFHFNNSDYDIDLLQFFSSAERAYIRAQVVPFPKSRAFPGHYLYDNYVYSRLVGRSILASGVNYDFIYAKGFTAWYLLENKKEFSGTPPPIGVNFHGYEMFQRSPGVRALLQQIFLLRIPVRRITRKADLVFSYGGKITHIIRKMGVPGEKIAELHTGVERSMLAEGIMPTPETVRFVFLGRYERRKGIEELNAAIRLLGDHLRRRCEFHFIGPIPAKKQVPGCFYHGEVRDPSTLTRLLRGFDVLVCPSWSEGMPNVILEAMAQGLSVIATNTGATSALVHQGTGWLIKNADPREIKEALEETIQKPRHAIDEKKHRALNLIGAEFVWEKIIDHLIARMSAATKQRP